jgi:hypothetical protein
MGYLSIAGKDDAKKVSFTGFGFSVNCLEKITARS